MSKISISDLHFANDVSFAASVDLQGGDLLQAAKNRAIAAREVAGGAASKIMTRSVKCEPMEPTIAGFKPAHPPKPIIIPITVGLIYEDPKVSFM